MANVLAFTEQFDNAEWSKFDGASVTADTHAAPAFAGGLAKGADTLSDPGAAMSSMFGAYHTIPNDSSVWTGSLYVRKDADAARFPSIYAHLAGGTALYVGVSINTVTGAVANAIDGAPTNKGVVDVDALWWRFWFTQANNSSGNTVVRLACYPAQSNTLGGSGLSGATGDVVIWGANFTDTDGVVAYIPEPFYDSDASWITAGTVGGAVGTFTDMTMRGGATHEWRVLAANAGGSSESNHVEAYVDGASPSFGVSRRAGHHTRREVFRTRRV